VNVLIDTNVILDVLMRRDPFFADSAAVLDRAERGEFVGWLCATTVTTIFFLLRKELGRDQAIGRLKDLTAICAIAPVNQGVVDAALESDFSDFEDAVLNHSALLAGARCIVTRNERDFRNSSLLVYRPSQFLVALG
jgi:predicted nucleic acid-binding protein